MKHVVDASHKEYHSVSVIRDHPEPDITVDGMQRWFISSCVLLENVLDKAPLATIMLLLIYNIGSSIFADNYCPGVSTMVYSAHMGMVVKYRICSLCYASVSIEHTITVFSVREKTSSWMWFSTYCYR